VADAIEELACGLPEGIMVPSLSQAYRFLSKMSAVDQERGRCTGNDLRSLLPMRRRSTEELMPLDVVTCDGHTFKAKIAHPFHGKPFQPEVCAVLDAATRKAIGWSYGLAESAETVADALRHAVQTSGIPIIFYTDPGSGNMAHINAHPAFGRYARIGIEFKTGLPGRTQARGLIERFQKSCWIRAAKRLDTYKGSDMDGTALYKITRILDRDVRMTGTSTLLPPWQWFARTFVPAAIEAYNNRPHSALPKITDEAGRRRHMSPNEMWAWFEEKGWQPTRATEAEVIEMFRPRVIKTTTRGEIRMFSNIYFHNDLQHYHKETVLVEYEPQDGSFVYVRDMDERLICKAEFNKNRDSYFPVSAIEKAADNRAARRAKIKELQLEEIEMERKGVAAVIDITPEQEAVANEVIMLAEHRRQLLEAPVEMDVPLPRIESGAGSDGHGSETERPMFANEWEKYEYLQGRGDATEADLAWMKDFETRFEIESQSRKGAEY
jgi:putative transposase